MGSTTTLNYWSRSQSVCVCARAIWDAFVCVCVCSKLPADPTDPGGGSEEGLTPANSLPLWVDWVQLYCSQAPSTPADEYSPFTLL